ncbi:hypothetical protein FOZ62_022919, partial [Perkinsus olseni]
GDWLEQEDAKEIIRWLTTANHAESCFAQADFSAVLVFPDPSFVDEQVRLFDDLAARFWLAPCYKDARLTLRVHLSPGELSNSLGLNSKVSSTWDWCKGARFVGATHWVASLPAALAVGASKKVLRSARIAGAGRESTYYAEVNGFRAYNTECLGQALSMRLLFNEVAQAGADLLSDAPPTDTFINKGGLEASESFHADAQLLAEELLCHYVRRRT